VVPDVAKVLKAYSSSHYCYVLKEISTKSTCYKDLYQKFVKFLNSRFLLCVFTSPEPMALIY
jgi:hypothetical protein